MAGTYGQREIPTQLAHRSEQTRQHAVISPGETGHPPPAELEKHSTQRQSHLAVLDCKISLGTPNQ